MNKFGKPILAIGAIIVLIAFNMDTSLESGYGRVNNIGLMAERTNYLIFGALLFIAGIILTATSKRNILPSDSSSSEEIKCPFCAESIKPEASLCKHCKSPLTPTLTKSVVNANNIKKTKAVTSQQTALSNDKKRDSFKETLFWDDSSKAIRWLTASMIGAFAAFLFATVIALTARAIFDIADIAVIAFSSFLIGFVSITRYTEKSKVYTINLLIKFSILLTFIALISGVVTGSFNPLTTTSIIILSICIGLITTRKPTAN